jgi:hypothetical protein
LFPWQLRQSLSNRFRFFWLISRCGCCSYQVSSISVRRETCYDHFCVFQFFSILANDSHFEKINSLKAHFHMAYDIPTRFHKVWSRHLWEIERTKMCGRIIIVKKKQNSNTSPDWSSGWRNKNKTLLPKFLFPEGKIIHKEMYMSQTEYMLS